MKPDFKIGCIVVAVVALLAVSSGSYGIVPAGHRGVLLRFGKVETGALPELLGEAADYYKSEVDYDLENLSAALEPLLIIAVGGIVLVLALGVFLPMWDMVAAVKGG